jgi:predicted nucleotidyltransferase
MHDIDNLLKALLDVCMEHYGKRLVSLAVYGSVGRGTPRPDSDIDVLVVAEDLPRGRINRIVEFRAVEIKFRERQTKISGNGGPRELSPVIKSPEEVGIGSPLFLDMIEDARILFDQNGFLQARLDLLKERLRVLGSKRIWKGSAWYWDLKPDFQPGEVFEL